MNFSVEIVTGSSVVEPGHSAPAGIAVTNRGDAPEKFELLIEGLDADWTAVPVPVFVVDPGQTHTERFFLKPPRDSQSAAGVYPYVVTIRSLETGEARKAQGVLEVKPYHHISIDINPRKVSCAYGREAGIEVTLINLGNSEHNVQLFANDQDDMFAFEFDIDQVSLAPGQQKNIMLAVTPTKRSLLANPRISPFSVTARSIDQPSVAAVGQGQVEQKALFTPGAFIIALSLLLLVGFWWVSRPKPPTIQGFTVNPIEATVGETVSLTWTAVNANNVKISFGDEELDRLPITGTHEFIAHKAGPVVATAQAFRDGTPSTLESKQLTVKEPVKAPAAEILSFDIKPRLVKLNQTVQVSYKLNAATVKATLSPMGGNLDPRGEGIQIPMNVAGDFTVKLIATNADGVSVEKSVKVTVSDESMATIDTFAVSPKEIEEDTLTIIKISWKVDQAARVLLKINDQPEQSVDALAGTMEYTAQGPTKITLTAYDASGKPISRTAKVVVKKKEDPVPPIDPNNPPPDQTKPPN